MSAEHAAQRAAAANDDDDVSGSGSGSGSETESDSEGETDSEEDEPQLKYHRLGASVGEILGDRAATCMAVSVKFIVLGTDYGTLHVLDSLNGTESKMYQQHSERITGVCIDRYGDFVATCSDDGKVVIRNLYEDSNVQTFSFDRPIRTVAIDPEYSKRKKNMFVTGGSKGLLVMHEDKGWGFLHSLSTKQRTLHAGEGTIEAIKWRGIFIAWANDLGIKVFDTTSQQRISYVDRPKNSPRPDLYRCRLCWKDDNTLLMGWADHIVVGEIRQRPASTTGLPSASAQAPQRYMQLLVRIETEFWIAGIAPFGDSMALLAYLDNEVDQGDGRKITEGDEPELKLMSIEGTESASDTLPINHYQLYRANDYWLECLPEDNIYYIVSPKDIVVATPCELDDRINWHFSKGRFEEALKLAKENQYRLQSMSMLDVWQIYLKHLLDEGQAEEAAKHAPEVFGTDLKLWERWILTFLKMDKLSAISPYIPTQRPQLSRNIYEQVLYHFLQKDHEHFYSTIESWGSDLYSPEKITPEVETQAAIHKNSVELSKALAILYMRANKHQDALRIYLDLGRLEAFDLIEKQNLFQIVKDRVVKLISLNSPRAMVMLRDNRDKLPVKVVMPQLEDHPRFQLEYLEALSTVEPTVGRDYGKRLVELTATHARDKLLRLLQSNTIPLRDATEICKRRELWREYAYCLQHGGKVKEAIKLMISKIGLVEEAIELVTLENDDSLWNELIDQCFASNNNEYIKTLLATAGTHIDPARIIQHPKLCGRKIEGLRDSLVKILSDFNLQKELLKGCTDILTTDVVGLMQKLSRQQKRAISVVPDNVTCAQCQMMMASISGKPNESFAIFHCKHIFCFTCLDERMADRERSRTTRNAAPPQTRSQHKYCPVCRSSEMEARRMRDDRRR